MGAAGVVTRAWDWQRIAEGRNPEWRELWEEGHDASSRRAIEDAVKRGQSVGDPQLSAVALGYIARQRRGLLVQMAVSALSMAIVVVSMYLTCTPTTTALCWFYVGVLIVAVTALPVRLLHLWRRLAQGERANRRLLESALGNPGP